MPSCTFRTSSSAALLAALLLAGCGTLDVPRADNYPATGQKKARAVHHWDVLANDVAARVAEKIAAWPAGEHPIHLTVSDKSSFSQGFLKLLRVQLLNRGVTLATGPTEVELQIEAQLVQHLEPLSASSPDLYYIERGDAPLYLPEPPPPPPPPPTPVKSWRVTAPTPVWATPATP